MVDTALLNHSVVSTWGDRVTVRRGNMAWRIEAVLITGYRDTPVGNTDVDQADPFFSVRSDDFDRTGAVQGDIIEAGGVSYSIVADPIDDGCGMYRVPVRRYS